MKEKNKKENQKNINASRSEQQYENNFMINWAEEEPPEHFAGDEQTDNFTVDNDYDKNQDLRTTSPMGGPFMHPMHDATLDTYENDLGLQVNQPDEEK